MSKIVAEVIGWLALAICGAGIITDNKDVIIIGMSFIIIMNWVKAGE